MVRVLCFVTAWARVCNSVYCLCVLCVDLARLTYGRRGGFPLEIVILFGRLMAVEKVVMSRIKAARAMSDGRRISEASKPETQTKCLNTSFCIDLYPRNCTDQYI